MGKKPVHIVKADGQQVEFDPGKLTAALQNSGASATEAALILDQVIRNLEHGMTTSRIYQMAYRLLKRAKAHRAAGRYRLKKALFALGPSGYPFETFVGRLFESQGYKVRIGTIMQGRCIQHEVDVLAERPGEHLIVECKFRADNRGKTAVQTPLYVQSRFLDIREKMLSDGPGHADEVKGAVVTNTRFTSDAISFATCVGLQVISWDHPAHGNLKQIIDQSGLHPITALHGLTAADQKVILDKGIVLCSELIDRKDILDSIGFSKRKTEQVMHEASLLIS